VRAVALTLLVAASLAAGCGDSGKGIGKDRSGAPERSAAADSASRHASTDAIRLAGCWMTVHLVRVRAERLRGAVPVAYSLGAYFDRDGTLALWTLDCKRMGAGPGALALLGAQVAPSPGGDLDRAGPASFHHYVFEATTDSAALRARLRRAGADVELAPELGIRRGATVTVTGRDHSASIRPGGLDRPHTHANTFWFGAARETALELAVPHANDRYCMAGRGCEARVSARRGSRLWTLLGRRTGWPAAVAFDHLRIRAATLRVRRGRPAG
jgi:hypothetical protein